MLIFFLLLLSLILVRLVHLNNFSPFYFTHIFRILLPVISYIVGIKQANNSFDSFLVDLSLKEHKKWIKLNLL